MNSSHKAQVPSNFTTNVSINLMALFGLLLVLCYFRPLLVFSANAIPSSFPDSWAFTWNIWRFGEVIAGNESLYRTALLFHPFGTSLALHTQAEGVLYPLSFLLPFMTPYQIFSLAAVSCFALNFLAGYGLFRATSGSTVLGFIVSLAFTFHPFFIGHLDAGHINFIAFYPVFLFFHRITLIIEKQTLLLFDGAFLALIVALLIYTNLYYTYFTFLALILLLPVLFLRFSSTIRFAFIMALLCGVCLASPKLLGVVDAYLSGEFRSDHNAIQHAASPILYICPGENQYIYKFHICEKIFGAMEAPHNALSHSETGIYVGLSFSLFFILLAFSRRREREGLSSGALYLMLAVLYIVISLGPTVPLFRLLHGLPFFPSVPIRFSIFAILFLFLAATAFFKERQLSLRVKRLFPLLLVITLFDYFPVPLEQYAIETKSPSLRQLAKSRHVRAIHDFTRNHYQRLIHQMEHKKRITSTFLARAPKVPLEAYRKNPFLLYVRKGVQASDDAVRRGWSNLEIQGAIVPARQLESVRQLQSLDWLEVAYEGGIYVFQLRAES